VEKKKSSQAGIVQFDVQNGRIETNMKVILNHLEKLSLNGVSLAVLPEMFSCGFDNHHLSEHATHTKKIIATFCSFAKTRHIAIAGSLPVNEDGKIFNTMIFIDTDGTIAAAYKKIHLFKLTDEHLFYSAGKTPAIVETSFGRIGMMICYDLRFPELSRTLFKNGVNMILVSAQWPGARKNHWITLSKARAIENQLFMICSNRTGTDGELDFTGNSMIIDPNGNVIADAGSSEGTASAVIKPELVTQARNKIPCMKDMRVDVYQ
jgi:omega-amidase